MSLFLILFSALLYGISRSSDRERVRVMSTPVVSAGRVTSGPVSLQGRARGEPPTAAVITGKLSAYWESELWDTRYRQNRLPVARESAAVPCIWLEDDSGRVPVVLHGVEWVFADEDQFTAGQTLPPGGAAFVERNGHTWESNRVRLKERRLEENAPMSVVGVAAPCADVANILDGLQHSVVGSAVSLVSSLRDPGASAREPRWLAAYLRAHFRPDQPVVWGERGALVISDRPPDVTARRFGWTALACRVGAGVLLLLAAIVFFA